jgi:molybdopterin converting factor small subunit
VQIASLIHYWRLEVSVKVKIPSLLSKYANGQELLEVEGDNLIECTRNLVIQLPELRRWLYNEQGELRPQVWFFVNGERTYNDEFTKSLKDDDELFFLLATGGG